MNSHHHDRASRAGRRGKLRSLALLAALLVPMAANAQGTSGGQTLAVPAAASPDGDAILLTIFLRHDESKPLGQIDNQLQSQGFFKDFPPPGIEVVSWYVMMGIGQVVTLRVPASRLREVNRAIETSAWGGFRTEFYPTYDYKSEALRLHAEASLK
jgi:hypothetical protein